MFELTREVKFQHDYLAQQRQVRAVVPSFRAGDTIEIECGADFPAEHTASPPLGSPD